MEQTAFMYRHLTGHDNDITALSFHPIQINRLVSSSLDGMLGLWKIDKRSGKKFRAHTSGVLDACYSPDGDLIATTSTDHLIRIWDPKDHINFTEYKAHHSAVRSVQFSPKGDKFVSASNDKNVMLWIPCRGKYFKEFKGHTSSVRCAKFSHDGKLLVSCSDDKTVKVWDITSGQCVKTFTNIRVPARYVEFHPTSTIIGSANEDGCIKLYDLKTNSLYEHYSVHDAGVNMVKFHPNGNFMLTASDDCTTKVLLIETLISYNLLNTRPIYSLREHYAKVTCIAFSNDGKLFASGCTNRQILVWKCDDLCVDGQSRENSIQQVVPSTTANRNLIMPSFDNAEQEFDGEDKKSSSNYLSTTFKKLHSESDDSKSILSAKIVKHKNVNITNVDSSQEDYAKYMPMFQKKEQPHSSKQSQTVLKKCQTSFNTRSSNQSIETPADPVVKQIQSLRHNYDVLEQRLTILEKEFKKLDR
ncbi:POC1 centriolar protein homolog A-like [Mycetomoellerius zeteki]|uniref:POC1 centriolar protein homolog A-like n=1 Tax=Mycetomoellerius zeteki TaxID=64791 RepID=UPI00084ECF62|nr:PREDICTED: POC1 centriolar protein homolog A-like [Trachymyrmex zeteki]